MRLRVEFTTEPFDLDEPPAHAVVAREIVQGAGLDAVDVGPFGNTAEGGTDAVLGTVDTLLRRSLAVGATRVSLQISVIAGDAADIGSADNAHNAHNAHNADTGESADDTHDTHDTDDSHDTDAPRAEDGR